MRSIVWPDQFRKRVRPGCWSFSLDLIFMTLLNSLPTCSNSSATNCTPAFNKLPHYTDVVGSWMRSRTNLLFQTPATRAIHPAVSNRSIWWPSSARPFITKAPATEQHETKHRQGSERWLAATTLVLMRMSFKGVVVRPQNGVCVCVSVIPVTKG